MKVSFDFDGVLDIEYIQKYAKRLVNRGIEVCIVTSRFNDEELYKRFFNTSKNVDLNLVNRDLKEIAKEIGISERNIYYTNIRDKWTFFKKHPEFIWHLDDDNVECKEISQKTMVKVINSWDDPSWKLKCEILIRKTRED